VRKIILLALFMAFMSAIFFGCQSKDNTKLQSDGEITKVSISKSSGFGKVNSDFFVVLDDKETLETFKVVISSAVKEEGIADMAEPEFDLEVIYANGKKQGYHLWVGEKGQRSTLMYIDNTHTRYTVSEGMTKKLIKLVQ
jgi:hypothetical protein